MEEKAGAADLEKFGVMLTLSSLSGGDITKIEAVLQMPYSVCNTWLFMEKEKRDYEKRYRKLLEMQQAMKRR